MGLLDADKFLTELTRLYEKHKGKGSVWVTIKRAKTTPPKKGEPAVAPGSDGGDGGEYKCLVRATDGSKKFSTTLLPNQIAKFHTTYTVLQKAHMDSLKSKKKEKKKPAAKGAVKTTEGKHTARA